MLKLSRNELLEGNISKGLVKICFPLIIMNLINVLYGVVDTYFVGMIDELEVGAISLISPIVQCGSAFVTGLCAAGIALISRAIGKNDYVQAKKVSSHLVSVSVVLGIVCCLILLVFGKGILIWFETPSEIFDSAYAYLFGIAFDFVFLFVVNIYQAICQGHGDSKSGVIANAISAILNCILDPIFIFSLNMGTLGAAVATCLSKALVTPYAIYRLKKDHLLSSVLKMEGPLLREIFLVALPSSIGSFLSSFGFILMQKEIAAYGSLALSAYGVGSKISSFYNIFINIWGSGLTTFIGASLGADMPLRARLCYLSSMKIVAITALVFVPLGLITSNTLIHLFISNISKELSAMALEYTYFSIFTSFAMGWFMNLCGVFNGSGNTLITMLLSGSRVFIIRIPIIKLLNRITDWGVSNIWIAMNVSNIIVCIIGTVFYCCYDWENRRLKF